MDLTLAVTVASFISGGAGAYLGSYLKRKGENLATHEDIDKLVVQVRAVTNATKEIEAKISGDLWDRQKQWELKREILFDAAKKLSEIENKLLSLHTFWRMRGVNQEMGEESQIRLEHQFTTKWQKVSRSFEETETLVSVTCSKETMMAFAELGDLLRSTAAKMVNGDSEIYTNTREERVKKIVIARVQIRKELGIKFDPTPSDGSDQ